jgi:DUF1365 family protein
VRHRRLHPREHHFTYSVFMAFLNIDELPSLLAVSPLTAYNRRGLLTYREQDHFGDSTLPLRQRLATDAQSSGHTLPAGPIYLLTNLRYAGYNFNPISIFYCYDEHHQLKLLLAEVNNTFGESHNYWLDGPQASNVPKRLHVSPFNTMDNTYRFALNAPGDTLTAHIDNFRAGHKFFDATLTLQREPWCRAAVHRAIVQFPFMTLKVITAIHWEALKLFAKRVPFVPNPGKANL